MKRIFLAAAVLATICSCDKIPKQNYLNNFTAEIESLSTKAVTNLESGKATFEELDEIAVSNGTETKGYLYEGGKFDNVSPLVEAESYTAVYPARICESIDPDGTAYLTFKGSYAWSDKVFNEIPVIAHTTSGEHFTFSQICGFISFNLEAGAGLDHIFIETHGVPVCGKAKISPRNVITMLDEGNDWINVEFPEDIAGSRTVLVPVPSKNYKNGITAKACYKDGTTFENSVFENVTVLPGRIISGTDFIASFFSGGNGTEGNPYILADMQDFKDFVAAMTDGEQRAKFGKSFFKLACDVNLSGEAIAPIGSETLPFEASLDGDGHTVKGLKFTGTATPAALFAKISGTVKNLNVEVDINTAGYNVGAIAGHAVKGALIENCHATGSVFGTGANSNKAYLGGLVGWSEGATIKGCSFTGQVSSTSNHVGGIVGEAVGGSYINCKLTKGSSVTAIYYGGGIVGWSSGPDFVCKGCVCEGNVSTGAWTGGGIVSYMSQGLLEDCVQSSSSYVTARTYNVGGIVGAIEGTADVTVNNCACYGTVLGQYQVGGIAGFTKIAAGYKLLFENCAAVGANITSSQKNASNYALVAGIASWLSGAGAVHVLNCCSAPESISGLTTSIGAIGGIAGYHNSTSGSIVNCYSATSANELLYKNAPISGAGLTYWGGITGRCTISLPYSGNWYNDGVQMTSNQSTCTVSGGGALSDAQMKDGTLLGKLNSGISAANSACSGATCANWAAVSGKYPLPENLPADTTPGALSGKLRVSIIGDSISSFAGWQPSGYTYHYPNASNCDVTSVEKTWWWRLIYDFMKNARLDMNISFSNSTVTQNTKGDSSQYWYGHDFCSRFVECSGMGKPDVIVIHGGTNDYGHNYGELLAPGIAMRSDSAIPDDVLSPILAAADAATTIEASEALPFDNFANAYTKLVRMMKVRYPNVKIVCLVGDSVTPGIQSVITKVAAHYNCKVVDFLKVNGFRDTVYMTKYDTGHVHPDSNGMLFMADKIYTECGAWLEAK